MTFPRSLTTTPFGRSSTGRFEACPCRPTPGGLLPSSVQHHKLSLVFVTHSRRGATCYPACVAPLLPGEQSFHQICRTTIGPSRTSPSRPAPRAVPPCSAH